MHAGRCKRGKPYIDSQVWPRNQESMHRWGSGVLQAEPFSFVATKIRIVCGRSLPRRLLQAGHSFLRQRRIESDAEGRCREPLQAEPFSFAATKNRIGRGSSLPRRALQAEPFFFVATKIRIGRGHRSRDGRCRRAIPHCCDDGAAVIPKFTLSNQESLQCKMRFQAKSCIDSQVWPRNQESKYTLGSFRGKPCIDSQVWA